MSVYILRWNPAISSYKKDHHKDLIVHLDKGEQPLDFNWSIREWENLKEDDFFILQQVGTDNDGIAMIGKFKGPCYESGSWRKDGTKLYYADMWIMEAFDCDENNILSAKRYEKLFPEIKWHGGHSGVVVESKVAGDLIVVIEKDMMKAGIWDNESLNNFRNYRGPQVFDDSDSGLPTSEDLADGKILVELKNRFFENQTEENLYNLAWCLHESIVKVPMHMELSDEAKEKLEKTIQEGNEEITFDDGVKYFPMTLQNEEGQTALGIYSNEDELGDHYSEDDEVAIVDLPVLDCIQFFEETEEISVIVLDAFTESLVISKELAGLITSMNTEEDEEGN